MITSVLATMAVALAMPGGGNSGGDYVPCRSTLYPTPQCCTFDIFGATDCGTRKSSLRLSNERDRLSTLLDLQPLPPLTTRRSSSRSEV